MTTSFKFLNINQELARHLQVAQTYQQEFNQSTTKVENLGSSAGLPQSGDDSNSHTMLIVVCVLAVNVLFFSLIIAYKCYQRRKSIKQIQVNRTNDNQAQVASSINPPSVGAIQNSNQPNFEANQEDHQPDQPQGRGHQVDEAQHIQQNPESADAEARNLHYNHSGRPLELYQFLNLVHGGSGVVSVPQQQNQGPKNTISAEELKNLIQSTTIKTPYTAEIAQFGETACVICLEDFTTEHNEIRKIKRCGHIFHDKCIKNWLRTHLKEFRCPLCKTDIIEVNFIKKQDSKQDLEHH
ncbi:UNKNOWN [Stylonychia lemnae]|uniref:RING-type domain-containing protein n=1 Tax=Stylonychia lemnae TaxID=5949 RepID=A0A078B8R1_STYLE|nr:UNKNOWN [Stylonychia lemnae]|eukprot:CDW90611.1 UNKNOWN [Stylonychia lemnae]